MIVGFVSGLSTSSIQGNSAVEGDLKYFLTSSCTQILLVILIPLILELGIGTTGVLLVVFGFKVADGDVYGFGIVAAPINSIPTIIRIPVPIIIEIMHDDESVFLVGRSLLPHTLHLPFRLGITPVLHIGQ